MFRVLVCPHPHHLLQDQDTLHLPPTDLTTLQGTQVGDLTTLQECQPADLIEAERRVAQTDLMMMPGEEIETTGVDLTVAVAATSHSLRRTDTGVSRGKGLMRIMTSAETMTGDGMRIGEAPENA